MFARVTTVQASAGRLDEGIRLFQEQTVPTVQGQAGFQGAYLLVDRQSGKARAITLWASAEAVQQSESAVRRQRERIAQHIGAGTRTVEHYEVAFSEGSGASTFARVTTAQGMTGDAETALRYVREQVLPGLRQAPGFAGMLHLVDREGGKALGISFWQSADALRGSADLAQQMLDGADRAGLGGTRSAEEYEVAVHL